MTEGKITRPALRYYGGKWRIADWIISFFPVHESYVEPCGGGGSVLLRKTRSDLETYNDLDEEVVNYFKVVRDYPDELIRLINLTPWSRREFELCIEERSEDPIERARKFYVRSWMSIHGGSDPYASDWKRHRTRKSPARLIRNIGHLYEVSDRLSLVQIENRDALEVIRGYDTKEALFYFDPPYVHNTRNRLKGYAIEPDDKWHVEAADLLNGCEGYIVVSGYANELYEEIYEDRGWVRFDLETVANSGARKTESLWLSPRTAGAAEVQKYKQMEMDF